MTDKDSEAAIKLFIEAIDIYEGEDKHIYIADTWRSCLAIMLRNGKTDSGIALLERMQRNFLKLEQMEYLRKAQLCVVILKVAHLPICVRPHPSPTFFRGRVALSSHNSSNIPLGQIVSNASQTPAHRCVRGECS